MHHMYILCGGNNDGRYTFTAATVAIKTVVVW